MKKFVLGGCNFFVRQECSQKSYLHSPEGLRVIGLKIEAAGKQKPPQKIWFLSRFFRQKEIFRFLAYIYDLEPEKTCFWGVFAFWPLQFLSDHSQTFGECILDFCEHS